MRSINKIILHCTATKEGYDYSVQTIRKWHIQSNGWRDIGYHYLIRLDGRVETGRPESKTGAHCSGHNTGSLGICYVGGLDYKTNKAKDTRTDAQKIALYTLVKDLMSKYNLTLD